MDDWAITLHTTVFVQVLAKAIAKPLFDKFKVNFLLFHCDVM